MTGQPITPRQIDIRDTYLRFWQQAMHRLGEQTEASRHGESNPEYAELADRLTAVLPPGTPPEMVAFLQGSVHAVVATVEHFCPQAD